MDYPLSFYWRDLLSHFPDAKVILSTRSPETWHKSVRESIYRILDCYASFPVSWCKGLLGMTRRTQVASDVCFAIPEGGFDTSMFGAIEKGEAASVEFFNKWHEEVVIQTFCFGVLNVVIKHSYSTFLPT